jgi:hypothetical protein
MKTGLMSLLFRFSTPETIFVMVAGEVATG